MLVWCSWIYCSSYVLCGLFPVFVIYLYVCGSFVTIWPRRGFNSLISYSTVSWLLLWAYYDPATVTLLTILKSVDYYLKEMLFQLWPLKAGESSDWAPAQGPAEQKCSGTRAWPLGFICGKCLLGITPCTISFSSGSLNMLFSYD